MEGQGANRGIDFKFMRNRARTNAAISSNSVLVFDQFQIVRKEWKLAFEKKSNTNSLSIDGWGHRRNSDVTISKESKATVSIH